MATSATDLPSPTPQPRGLPLLRPADPSLDNVPVPPAAVWTGLTPQLRARVCQEVLLAVQEVVRDADGC